MVTAETAVVLPVLLVVMVAGIWVLVCVLGQLRCIDAARVGARAAARGDAVAAVTRATSAVAPPGARVLVQHSGDEVTVVVRATLRPFGRVLSRLPSTPLEARATAVVER